MLAKFYDSLKKKEEANKKIPKSVAKVINNKAPKGFTAYYDKNLKHIIVAPDPKKNAEINIKFDIYPNELSDLPDWAKKDKTSLIDYLYRTQRPLKVSDASIKSEDGKDIKFEDMVQDPLGENQKITNQRIMIFPDPFPKAKAIAFQLKNGEDTQINFERKPYAENNQMKFQNTDNKALDISLIISEGENNKKPSKMQIAVKPQNAKTVTEVVKALKFFKDYVDGNLKINGARINKKFLDGKYSDSDKINNQIEFWDNLQKLEKILNVEFDPARTLSQQEYVVYNQLTVCLIEDKALELKSPLKFITVNKEALEDKNFKENLEQRKGLALTFITSSEKIALLGVNFTLASANVMKDIVFDKVEKTKDGGNIYIISADDKRPWFLYKKYIKPNENPDEVLLNLQQQYLTGVNAR